MPGTPQDPAVSQELPAAVIADQEGVSRAGSPDWGGVDLSGGDNADATSINKSEPGDDA